MSLLKFRVLTPLLTSRVSCLSPWARQDFRAQLKPDQTLSHIYEKRGRPGKHKIAEALFVNLPKNKTNKL